MVLFAIRKDKNGRDNTHAFYIPAEIPPRIKEFYTSVREWSDNKGGNGYFAVHLHAKNYPTSACIFEKTIQKGTQSVTIDIVVRKDIELFLGPKSVEVAVIFTPKNYLLALDELVQVFNTFKLEEIGGKHFIEAKEYAAIQNGYKLRYTAQASLRKAIDDAVSKEE